MPRKKSKATTVKIICTDCDASGIYRVRSGVGVVCGNCNGKGWTKITFTAFTARVQRSDVSTVVLGNRSLAFAREDHYGSYSGIESSEVSYSDFVAGQMPVAVPVTVNGLEFIGASVLQTRRICTMCEHWRRGSVDDDCSNGEAKSIFGLSLTDKMPEDMNGQYVGHYCPFWTTNKLI